MTRYILHTIKPLKVKLLLIGFFLIIAIYIILRKKNFDGLSNQEFQNSMKKNVAMKSFVYLIQTEQCLLEYFLQVESVLDATECHCDVIVYSYQTECLDTQYKHIFYLYQPDSTSTLNTGKNLVYKVARERNVSYLYYIFIDGDIQLTYNEVIAPKSMMRKSPMRSFEQFLIEKEPGVGVADYLPHHGASFIISKVHENCNVNPNTDLTNRTSVDSLHLTTVHFDACFNAFHHEIVDEILPFILDFDEINWHFSQIHLISLIELRLRGQVLLFRPVIAQNVLHGKYPIWGEPLPITWPKIAKKIVLTMPKRYQDNNWVIQYSEDPIEHTENSLTICFTRPIQDSFKTYSHFGLNWSV